MNTPWGRADSNVLLAPGVHSVCTPGHGGILVAKAVAQQRLGPEALSIGDPFGQYLAFEEDCAYAAVLADWPDLWRQMVKLEGCYDAELENATDEEIRNHFLKTCYIWYPDEYGVNCQWCKPDELCWRHVGRMSYQL